MLLSLPMPADEGRTAQITTTLRPEERDALRQLAHDRWQGMSDLVRGLILAELARREATEPMNIAENLARLEAKYGPMPARD